ncbi:MFS transporter [Pokkaliibacter plantistimulans]|uniref:MFS transporter n=1 Tax=Proteobacteria bacterium 228 TaxID=2083153 RepID=A0A2S5KXF8_9PROT|nr:MFS transporter [Pokkaliibacter plantistimulans]PPC79470.1 MFS transporter [Pokkaliibacter plantistimulans]
MSTLIKNINFRIAVTYGLGVMAAMTVSEAVTELGNIAKEFHPDDPSKIGWVMSLPSLMVALGALLAGFFVDRFGDRRVLFTGALVIIVGDLFVMSAPSFEVLLIARAFTGIGYVMTAVAAVTLLMRITSGKQRTMAMALWSTFVPASFILPFLSAGLSAHFGSWRAAFTGHTLVTVILLLLAFVSLPKRTEQEKTTISRTRGLASVLRSPLPYLLGLSFGADAFLQTGVIASLAHYLSDRYDVSQMAVSHLNVFAMICNTVGCLLVGFMLNRGVRAVDIGITGTVLMGLAALALYVMPIGFSASIAASWIFMLASGLLVGMWAMLPVVAPSRESTGATSGLVTQITLVGVFLGPPMFFKAQAMGSMSELTLIIGLALVLCMSALPIWLRSHQAKPAAAADTPEQPFAGDSLASRSNG